MRYKALWEKNRRNIFTVSNKELANEILQYHMNTYILFPNSFPAGGSSTQRVLHIAMALSQTGMKTEVLIYRGTENKKTIVNEKSFGVYKGIKFKYSLSSTIWPDSKTGKIANYIFGLVNLFKYLIVNLHSDSIVLLYADYSIVTNYIIKLATLLKNAKYVYLVDEYPWCVIYKEKYYSIYKKIYLISYYKAFHGIVSMTKTLEKYYSRFSTKKCIHYQLPMTVDINRFKNDTSISPFTFEYIAYCGGESPDYNKDGIDYLIDAFKLICYKFQNIKLVIIGNVTQKRIIQAKELGISDLVIFMQKVSSETIPQLLKHAKLLLLARPDNIQAQGGFPTKLGEYLACGVPVVVTATGEITDYLTDGINAFIAKPNDPIDFAKKMDEALSDYKKAESIGQNGYYLAINIFDYHNYAYPLYSFLHQLM